MTFEQFQATRVQCNDLGEKLADAMWDGEPAAHGYVYLDALYISDVMPHWPEQARAAGKFHLLLERSDFISNDLETLERLLYEFAESAGYFED